MKILHPETKNISTKNACNKVLSIACDIIIWIFLIVVDRSKCSCHSEWLSDGHLSCASSASTYV